jgi:hypothetical protein
MKQIIFKARQISKTFVPFPYIIIYANPSTPGWSDWAFQVTWLCWAIGFRVKNYD